MVERYLQIFFPVIIYITAGAEKARAIFAPNDGLPRFQIYTRCWGTRQRLDVVGYFCVSALGRVEKVLLKCLILAAEDVLDCLTLNQCVRACVRECVRAQRAPDSGDGDGGWAVTHPVYPFYCCYLAGFDVRFDW